MSNVVLFIDYNGDLGNIFHCENEKQVKWAVKYLLEQANKQTEGEFFDEVMMELEDRLKYDILYKSEQSDE